MIMLDLEFVIIKVYIGDGTPEKVPGENRALYTGHI